MPATRYRLRVTWAGQRVYVADVLWTLTADPDQARVWGRRRAAEAAGQFRRGRAWRDECEAVAVEEFMPVVAEHIGVFSSAFGCFRMVARPTPDGLHVHGQPTHCPSVVVARGWHQDRSGRWHELDACTGHRGDLAEWWAAGTQANDNATSSSPLHPPHTMPGIPEES